MFPIKDSVPSRSVPVVTRALILINAVVFFFELSLPQESVEQIFYLSASYRRVLPIQTGPHRSVFRSTPIGRF